MTPPLDFQHPSTAQHALAAPRNGGIISIRGPREFLSRLGPSDDEREKREVLQVSFSTHIAGTCFGAGESEDPIGSNVAREDPLKSMNKILALCVVAGSMLGGSALADTSGKRIAFSNNYAGNSWRQAMLKSYDIVTKKAVADKVVGAADVFTTADKDVPTQAAQIQNLILQGYDAIVINASSPDALNGAIKQACDAGIVVVSFDGIVTEPCAYRVVVDFKDMGKQEVGADGQVPAQGRQPARNPRARRHVDRRCHPYGNCRGGRRPIPTSRSSAR